MKGGTGEGNQAEATPGPIGNGPLRCAATAGRTVTSLTVTGRSVALPWRRRVAILVVALAAMLGGLPAVAPADDGLALHLVTGPDYKPFTDPHLPLGGMQSQIVRAAFAKVGDKVTIDFEPWARGYAETRRLEFDATFPYARTQEREKDFLYSNDIYVQLSRPYVLAGSTLAANAVGDLAGRTLCSPHGYYMSEVIQRMVAQQAITLERPPGMEQCFKMLQLHRVDAVICIDIQARATALQLFGRQDAVKPLAPVIALTTHNLIVSRQRPGADRILADFNRGLAMLKASGEFDTIVKSQIDAYFGQISN